MFVIDELVAATPGLSTDERNDLSIKSGLALRLIRRRLPVRLQLPQVA
jgi:hypothetical protein